MLDIEIKKAIENKDFESFRKHLERQHEVYKVRTFRENILYFYLVYFSNLECSSNEDIVQSFIKREFPQEPSLYNERLIYDILKKKEGFLSVQK